MKTPGVQSRFISTGCIDQTSTKHTQGYLTIHPLVLDAGWVSDQLRAADKAPAAILQEVQDSMASSL